MADSLVKAEKLGCRPKKGGPRVFDSVCGWKL